MSPYEVKLLIHIDSTLETISPSLKKPRLLYNTITDFIRRGLIEGSKDSLSGWKTTEFGRAVCNRFYNVTTFGIRFCGECGQLIE